MSLLQRVHDYLSSERKASTAELVRWVQEPSLAGAETGVQQQVVDALKALKMEVKMEYIDSEEIAKDPNFLSPRREFDTSPNVVGILKGSDPKNGKSLIINGHQDVVPEGDLSQWDASPFSGKIDQCPETKKERLFGRGVTDMKGGTFAALLALRALHALGIKLKGDVLFHSVVEEESGGAGTLWLVKKGYGKADLALIPEPSGMKIFPQQQGSQWFRVRVKGVGAHGGTRYEGVSALEKAILVHNRILQLEKDRNAPLKEANPLMRDLTIPIPINIGKIEGGKWPSSVPDDITLEGRMGIIPGETIDHAREAFAQAINDICANDAWLKQHPPQVEWFGARWLPGTVDVAHPSLAMLQKVYKEVTAEEAYVGCSPWGTDGGLLNQLAGTPSIVLGPGVTKMAHFPNEYIYLDDVYKCAEIYALAIAEWCGVA